MVCWHWLLCPGASDIPWHGHSWLPAAEDYTVDIYIYPVSVGEEERERETQDCSCVLSSRRLRKNILSCANHFSTGTYTCKIKIVSLEHNVFLILQLDYMGYIVTAHATLSYSWTFIKQASYIWGLCKNKVADQDCSVLNSLFASVPHLRDSTAFRRGWEYSSLTGGHCTRQQESNDVIITSLSCTR